MERALRFRKEPTSSWEFPGGNDAGTLSPLLFPSASGSRREQESAQDTDVANGKAAEDPNTPAGPAALVGAVP